MIGLVVSVSGAVALGAALWVALVHNTLVRLRQHTLESWSQVDVELERRRGLVPNLVETVRGWARHEQATLSAALEQRALRAAPFVLDSGASNARITSELELAVALGGLLVACEAYPELASSAGFRRVTGELAHTEDRIAAAMRFYNANVRAYETRRQQVPDTLVARMFEFPRIKHYRLPQTVLRDAPAPTVAA